MEEELHDHLPGRMEQRGITREEVAQVLEEGWETPDAKPGTHGRTFVFAHDGEWEGRVYEEKEITVYLARLKSRGPHQTSAVRTRFPERLTA